MCTTAPGAVHETFGDDEIKRITSILLTTLGVKSSFLDSKTNLLNGFQYDYILSRP